jgi:hypothetical protein
MNENDSAVYIDCQHKPFIYFTRYFGIILFLACALMLITSIFSGKGVQYITRTVHIVILVGIVGLFIERYLRRVAYKIIIDYSNKKISFYMCRNYNVKEYSFSAILAIKIKNHIRFVFDKDKVLYNAVGNRRVKDAVRRILN